MKLHGCGGVTGPRGLLETISQSCPSLVRLSLSTCRQRGAIARDSFELMGHQLIELDVSETSKKPLNESELHNIIKKNEHEDSFCIASEGSIRYFLYFF